MLRGALRATRVALDGRNRFPISVPSTQTRRRNDRKRLDIIQENARIIREGRRALMRRMHREKQEADTLNAQQQAQPTSSLFTDTR